MESQLADVKVEHPARRCQNRALAAWRKARAVELAVGGASYDVIARQVGYSHRGTAYRAVRTALKERTAAAADQLRQQELDRLGALQHAVWQQAMAGDVGAVLAAHKIVMSRCRLLGLDKPEKARDPFAFRSVVLTDAELQARAAPVPE